MKPNRMLIFGPAPLRICRLVCIHLTLLLVATAAGEKGHAPRHGLPTAFARTVRPLDHVEQFAPRPFDLKAVLDEDARRGQRGGPLRFAFGRPVEITTEDYGLWEHIDDETLMWRLQVTSPGAVSLNLQFGEFFMPPSAGLYIYSVDGAHVMDAFGARHNKPHGKLWTPIIQSDEIVIEVTIAASEIDMLRLKLSLIGHGYRKFDSTAKNKAFGDSGACNVNVTCPAGDPWRDQIRSVAKYYVSDSSGHSYTCTGTLLNNTTDNGKPYFLTAFHCFDNADIIQDDGKLTDADAIAASIIVYWNHEASTCTGSTAFANQQQLGAVYRAGHVDSDFVLVELDEIPSSLSEVYYAGWDRRSVAPTSAVTIHHPQGDIKKISVENDTLLITSWEDSPTLPNGTHLRVDDWDVGTTESGSSGSALFNSAGKVVGQLHGGEAKCENNLPDLFGRFYKSWAGGGTSSTRLRDWLDPLALGAESIDGKEGPKPTDPFEPDNSFDLAGVIEPGVTQIHSLAPVGDKDCVKFSIDVVSEVVIETSGADGDTKMLLYNEAFAEIDSDDDSGAELFSRIERTCGVNALLPGTYYVRIDEYNNDGEIAAYNLDLSVTASSVDDLTGDCFFDYLDFGVLANGWLECGIDPVADVTDDGCVNSLDLLQLADQWLR